MFDWFKRKETKKKNRRSFAGAQVSRLTADFMSTSSSSDASVRASIDTLRNRSRQLVRDNDYARNIVREMQNNVVGMGIGLQAQVPMKRGGKLDQRINDQIEWAWDEWKSKEN